MVTIHIINILFCVLLTFITFVLLINISAGEIPPINPVIIGTLAFLWLSLITNYIVQIKNRHSWWVIIMGSVLFLTIVLFVLLIMSPHIV